MRDIDSEKEERILTFMESLAAGNTAFLNSLEKEALGEAVPIIRTQTQSLLRFLLELTKPARILEVGTATGFSACLMLNYAPEGTELTTIERDPERIEKARRHFALIDEDPAAMPGRHSAQITLLEGDAAEILKGLKGPYDFIFMDAAKGQYINFLPDILRLLSPGGLLISDNVLQDGDIIESRFAVTRRNRTIHARMREYLYELKHHPELETVILPVGDGVTLSTKVVRNEENR